MLAVASTASLADTPAPFVGVWKVKWQGATRPQEAKLVITPTGGTWKTYASSSSDPCVGREAPIVLSSTAPDKVTIDLKYSSVINGCSDVKVQFQAIDDKLVGKRGKYDAVAERN